MFKKTILVLVFLLLAISCSFATNVTVISPIEKTINRTEITELGSAQAGEKIELVFSTNQGIENWNKVNAIELPEEWNSKQNLENQNKETLILEIQIPTNAKTGAYRLETILENKEGKQAITEFLIFIEENLITSKVDQLVKESIAGNEIQFTFNFVNDSIASNEILINSNLPITWYTPVKVKLPAKEIIEKKIKISPKNYGKKSFTFQIISKKNNKILKEIKPKIEVKPTLKSKYQAGFYGFPFFTPNLSPYYIFNSFISSLLK